MASAVLTGETPNHSIRFLLNGELVTVDDVDPTCSVLAFLRERRRLTGTKEGCAEGDCGACTVVLGELHGEAITFNTVNACIQFVPTLDGKAVYTVDGLRQSDGSLHPAQQAMVDCHGSQCGFCTPGFVMSLWNVYRTHQAQGTRPSEAELRTALTGNLCRCTGYRPILEAGHKMFDLPAVDFDHRTIKQQLHSLRRDGTLTYSYHGSQFFAPRSLDALIYLRKDYPEATLLAGCTDIGLWVNKQFRDLGDIIYIGEVDALKCVSVDGEAIHIGAGATLTDAYGTITEHYPQVAEMWERFASVPIRNAGTLGGNIANGSPIGDSMPWLIALGARVVLRNADASRTMALEDLYVGYMQKSMLADEIVAGIEVPLPQMGQQFRTYKLSKRFDSDISAVCAAFSINIDANVITHARVAFGGMAATVKRAAHCEQTLMGRPWNDATARTAMTALATDYQPLSDMRASSANRLQSAENLLYRFYLETRPENPLPIERLSVFAAA